MNAVFDTFAGWKLGNDIHLLKAKEWYVPTDLASQRILRCFGMTSGVPARHYQRFVEVANEFGYTVEVEMELMVERDDRQLHEQLATALIHLTEALQRDANG